MAANAVDPSGRIPIVSPVMQDPVQRGLATSLSRPGGNITGFTLMHTELNAKRLELLRTAFPHITAVTALVNPASASWELSFEQTETAARSMGLESIARAEAESAAALRALRPTAFSGVDAVIVVPDGLFSCSIATGETSSRSSMRRACPPSIPSGSTPTTAG
jgi:putative ABC transport system substrate-binding protein